jgi:hypothetical protein
MSLTNWRDNGWLVEHKTKELYDQIVKWLQQNHPDLIPKKQ